MLNFWTTKGGPKFLGFFPLLPPQFSFFFLSLGVLSWNFGGVFEAQGPCNVLSGCRVRAPAAGLVGPPGGKKNEIFGGKREKKERNFGLSGGGLSGGGLSRGGLSRGGRPAEGSIGNGGFER